MDIEEVKDELYRLKSDIRTGYPLRTKHQKERFMQSIDRAIASLEAWGKVTDELEELRYNGDFKITYSNCIKRALEIINKHLKEIEK